MALKARAPIQIIQALSMSNVNTRRIREATEHLARQSVMIERTSEAKNVYEEDNSGHQLEAPLSTFVNRCAYEVDNIPFQQQATDPLM